MQQIEEVEEMLPLADCPRFLSHPLGLCLMDGDEATLECRISGNYAPFCFRETLYLVH